jgi:hypothetical protein
MRALGRGDVIMISSVAAQNYGPRFGVYAIAKSGMEAMAYTLAKEERQHGIRVNIVAPGLVETDMGKRLVDFTRGVSDIRTMDAQMPFGFVCQPEDIANAVAFLCSDEGRYITNQRLTSLPAAASSPAKPTSRPPSESSGRKPASSPRSARASGSAVTSGAGRTANSTSANATSSSASTAPPSPAITSAPKNSRRSPATTGGRSPKSCPQAKSSSPAASPNTCRRSLPEHIPRNRSTAACSDYLPPLTR